MAKLGDICDILNGYAFKSEEYVEDGIRIIRIANVQKGFIEDTSPVFYPINSVDATKYLLYSGDLLMSLTGNVGRVAIIDEKFLPAALNQRVACIRIKDESIVLKGFLFHSLCNDHFEKSCIQSSKGVAQKNISTEWLKEHEILLPSIQEQYQIASVLDKLSSLISLRKQQLAKLDKLIKARFVEMFGDPITNSKCLATKELRKIITLQRGYDLPVQNRDSSGNIPVYGANGVLDRHSQSKSACGVITGRSGTIGKVYYCKEKFWPLNTTLFSVETYGNNIIYLAHLLEYYRLDRFHDGTGVPTLNRNVIHCQLIIDVPVDQQENFATFDEQVTQQKLTIQRSLDKLEVLKKSLMQEYFG